MDLELRRLELNELFVSMLDGRRNVYFQPPNNTKMQYPCIVYNREKADIKFADNALYLFKQRYQVTLISMDPDSSVLFQQIILLPMTVHDRSFAVDNLNHDVFTLYF